MATNNFRWGTLKVVLGAIVLLGYVHATMAADVPPKIDVKPDYPSVVVPQMEEDAVIDGVIDEPVWKQAARIEHLHRMSKAGRGPIADYDTEVLLSCTEKNLFVAFLCQAANADNLRTYPTQNKNEFNWYQDSVEIFLSPACNRLNVFHFAVNTVNSRWEAQEGLGLAGEHWRPEPDWESAAKVYPDQKRYVVEVRIPLATLGAVSVRPGTAWVAKFARMMPIAGAVTWPHTAASGFKNMDYPGYLFFQGRNMLADSLSASGNGAGLSPAWMGTARRTAAGGRKGTAIQARGKIFLTLDRPVENGQKYHFSARVKSSVPVTIGIIRRTPHGVRKETFATGGAQAPEAIERTFTIADDGAVLSALSFEPSVEGARFSLEDMMLELVPGPLDAFYRAPLPHPFHKLDELSRRVNGLPYDRLFDLKAGRRVGERVVFRDTATGAALWRMTTGLTRTGNSYTYFPSWTGDGKYVVGGTVIPWSETELGKSHGRWWQRSDGSEYILGSSGGTFDPLHPAFVYQIRRETGRFVLVTVNIETGEERVLQRFDADLPAGYYHGGYDIHTDGKMLCFTAQPAGTSENAEKEAFGYFVSPEKGLVKRYSFGHMTHGGPYFLNLKDDYRATFIYEIGTYPKLPRGLFTADLDGNITRIGDDLPHGDTAPDGRRFAFVTEYGADSVNIDGSDLRPLLKMKSSLMCSHLSWCSHPDFLTTDGSPDFNAPLFRLSGDEKNRRFTNLIAYANSRLYGITYYSSPFPVFSPDGTKIFYNSSMLGGVNAYNAVARKPEPPRNLAVRKEGGRAVVTWEPSALAREVRGYQVYQGTISGGPYTLLTGDFLTETNCTMDIPESGAAYVVVTGREWSGLLSGFSEEVCVSRSDEWPGPVRIVLEAERGDISYPMQEQFFPLECGNLYAAGISEAGGEGSVRVTAVVPKAGTCTVWARMRSPQKEANVRWTLNRQAGTTMISSVAWEWKKLGVISFGPSDKPPYHVETVVRARSEGFGMDQIFLTTTESDRPQGRMAEWGRTPARVTGGQAAAETPFRIVLSWTAAPGEEDIDHYNVYASSEGPVKAVQERLVASPMKASFLDWGIRAGTIYRYLVTAVDRWGVEGPATEEIVCQTPAITPDEIRLRVDKPMKDKEPIVVNFTTKNRSRHLIWVEFVIPDNSAVQSAWFNVKLDQKSFQWVTDFTPVSGLGETGIPLWRAVSCGPADGIPFELAPGEHRLELGAINVPSVVREIRITDDLGHVPEGMTSFLDFIKLLCVKEGKT